ncbi:hypothetical protein KI429_19410 [Pseudomonas shirazica]|nr:hypothetical protein KI429_19410 [Pseudomonas shirazica]
MEIVLTVVPNKSRKDHLWMKKATFTSFRDGKVIERDFLTGLRAANKVGESGACLKKLALVTDDRLHANRERLGAPFK